MCWAVSFGPSVRMSWSVLSRLRDVGNPWKSGFCSAFLLLLSHGTTHMCSIHLHSPSRTNHPLFAGQRKDNPIDLSICAACSILSKCAFHHVITYSSTFLQANFWGQRRCQLNDQGGVAAAISFWSSKARFANGFATPNSKQDVGKHTRMWEGEHGTWLYSHGCLSRLSLFSLASIGSRCSRDIDRTCLIDRLMQWRCIWRSTKKMNKMQLLAQGICC